MGRPENLPSTRPPSGDVVPAEPDEAALEIMREVPLAPFEGVGTLATVLEQRGKLDRATEVLSAPTDPALIAIKPTGELYVPQVHYRRRLNAAFPLAWGIRPLPGFPLPKVIQETPGGMQKVVWPMELVVYGTVVACGVGQGSWTRKNPRASLGDAAESAKSDALVRACKDLGLFSECWDPVFAARFVAEHCVRVAVPNYDGKPEALWRRKDQDPFVDERGEWPVGDRPPGESFRRPSDGQGDADPFLDGDPQPRGGEKGGEPRGGFPDAGRDGDVSRSTGTYIVPEDIRKLMGLCREYDVTEDALKQHMLDRYQCHSRKQIRAVWFGAILEWVRGHRPEPGAEG